jgi:L-fucose isomerase-like protein
MPNTPVIAALPVGEFNDQVRREYSSITGAFNRLGADLVISDPVSDEAEARRSVQKLSEKHPDLFLIITLRGLSAPIIEAAAQSSGTQFLIWPVQGSFALASSSLAAGALHESGGPVELHYAPPDHPDSIERIRLIIRAATAYSRIRRSRIGIIGGLFPNLVSCRYDPQTINSRLGATIFPIPFDEVRETIQSISLDVPLMDRTRQEISSSFSVDRSDVNALEAGMQLHLALKKITLEQKIDGFATECWSGFPRELGLNPCF